MSVDGLSDDARRYRIGRRKMEWADKERTPLVINDHVRIGDTPLEAHHYEVHSRIPLEWFVDRYRVKKDRRSGIVNDPNG